MTQHTPASCWKYKRVSKLLASAYEPPQHVIENNGDTIALVYNKEDTRLIAAAPDLLNALIELDQQCQAGEAYQQGTFETVQAAIHKAKGE